MRLRKTQVIAKVATNMQHGHATERRRAGSVSATGVSLDAVRQRIEIINGADEIDRLIPGFGTAIVDILHAVELGDRFEARVRSGHRLGADLFRALSAAIGLRDVADRADEIALEYGADWVSAAPIVLELAETARAHTGTLLDVMPSLRRRAD